MVLRVSISLFCLFFFCSSLHAQVIDTTHRADTVGRVPHVVIDSPEIDTADLVLPTEEKKKEEPKSTYKGSTVYGKVVDMNTGEGIPFATVFFPRSEVG